MSKLQTGEWKVFQDDNLPGMVGLLITKIDDDGVTEFEVMFDPSGAINLGQALIRGAAHVAGAG